MQLSDAIPHGQFSTALTLSVCWPHGSRASRTYLFAGAILDSMGAIDSPAVANELIECLRSDDAALRNEAIEIFKRLTTDVSPTLNSLLSDPDPDLRILAVNILESRREPNVELMLIGVIAQDRNINVCATAIDLLCEVGTEAALDLILRLKDRFASEAYLQFATDLALKRICGN